MIGGTGNRDLHGMIKVAKQERKSQNAANGAGNGSGNQPITRHPLFPAIIALWVAALFGLGSMLLSPATIERFVGMAGLSAAVPMAAPPLGGTARMLVALAMTGIGAIIGAAAGLRLARSGAGHDDALPDRSDDGADAAPELPTPGRLSSLAGRRRGLEAAAEADTIASTAPTPADMTAPQIFQLAEFDLDTFSPKAADTSDAPAVAADEPEAEAHDAEDVQVTAIDSEITVGLPPLEESAIAALSDGTSFDSIRQPREEEVWTPPVFTQAFSPAAWADNGHDEEEEFKPAPAPLKAAPLFESYTRNDSASAYGDVEAGSASHMAAETFEEAVQQSPLPAPQADEAAAASAAERIAAASLDTLSHVELLERLALAMEEQRRKLLQAQATPLTVVPPASQEASDALPLGDSSFGAPQFSASSLEQNHTANPVPPTIDSPSDEGGSNSSLAPSPTSPDTSFEPSAAETGPTLGFPPASVAAPFAPPPFARTPFSGPGLAARADALVSRIPDPQPLDDDFAIDETPASSVVSPLFASGKVTPIPAKLRPVGLASFDEDDVLPGYIPPRHISLAAAASEERPVAGLASGHDFASIEADEDENDDALAFAEDEDFAEDGADVVEEDVLEEGYSSLLSMQRRIEPRPDFIALEDEQAEAPLEPLTNQSSEAPTFTAPSLPGARLFDPPARTDPAETEKALRAALATLQRMSGSH